MTPRQALSFVKANGITLESGRGPVPSVAQAIAGEPIRGSWWAHPKGAIIFRCSRAIRESKEVLVCRLVAGKVTYVHRRLWPALVRLSATLDSHRLAAIREIHTTAGKHRVETTAFPKWVPSAVGRAAARLALEQAAEMLRTAGITKALLSRALRDSKTVSSRAKSRDPVACRSTHGGVPRRLRDSG